MGRLVAVVVHLLVPPAGVLLSLVAVNLFPRVSSGRSIDVAPHGTLFVVAYFHTSILLGSFLGVATAVAYSYRSLNWALGAAWALFFLHVGTALVPWHPPLESPAERGTFVSIVPTDPSMGYLYLASAGLGVMAAVVGLITSMVKALRSRAVATT